MIRFLFLSLLLLFGCSHPKQKKKELRLAFQTSPTTLDPGKSGDFLSSTLICLLYEGLTRALPREDARGDVEFGIAEQVTISSDGTIYTFYLRDALWSDGQPVTAFNFEHSWKRLVDPSFPCLSAYLVLPIKNAEKCLRGELPSSDLAVRALNAKTFQVTLEKPTPWFFSLTAFPLFLPIPSHAAPDASVCNGPFHLTSSRANQSLVLKKNNRFWNRSAIALDGIEISIIPDENTALHLFEKGEIDWLGAPLSPIPFDALPSLIKEGKIVRVPMLASTFLSFNVQNPIFQNLSIRKALSFSINREELVKETTTGQIAAMRPLPPSLSTSSAPLFEFDPQRAQEFLLQGLQELKVTLADLPPLILSYRPGPIEKRLVQALQRQWKERLGIEVQIQQFELKLHMEKLYQRDYQMALSSWIAQFDDPMSLLERYRLASHQKNFAGWESKHYQHLIEEAGFSLDEKKRGELFQQAEELLAEELPFAPLYHWSSPTLYHEHIIPGGTTPAGGILFERFDLLD
ncbi:MAG TPA: peptide ABC transporter substrate-binding protein [Chlamydiales bacterium]|nr:peptide ABC transporter substrate-binding protein [Chlamydiales bacterium]